MHSKNIEEILLNTPNYFQTLIFGKMLEEVVTSETLGISEIEHENNSKPHLTEREIEVLIEATKDNYSGGFISHVAEVLEISERTVKYHLANISQKFGVIGIFCLVYHAFYNGFLSVEDVAKEAYIKSRLAMLTAGERKALTAYATNALDQGYIAKKRIAPILAISPNTLRTHIRQIYNKCGIRNYAQLAVFAYAYSPNMQHQAG